MGGTQITADDELFINPRVYKGAVCARVCVCAHVMAQFAIKPILKNTNPKNTHLPKTNSPS